MPLFEIAILETPTRKDAEEGATEKLVFGPVYVVAKDGQSAAMRAVLDNTEKMASVNKDRMQVLCRPFA
jgi:F420-dependent methylenetetrahydromethanopterin dehydrogenase